VSRFIRKPLDELKETKMVNSRSRPRTKTPSEKQSPLSTLAARRAQLPAATFVELETAIQKIDQARHKLLVAEDELVNLCKKSSKVDRLLGRFWAAGGVTYAELLDWLFKRGKFTRSRQVSTRHRFLRLVVENKPIQRRRLHMVPTDGDAA
jgi:hypothetical protein